MSEEPHRWPFGKPHWACEPRGRIFAFGLSAAEVAWVLVAVAVLAAAYLVDAIRGMLSIAIGAWTIRAIVRAVNRRDDPRHTKRPPDAP